MKILYVQFYSLFSLKSDIGIITPYAAQVRLIQDMLIQRGLVQRPRLNQESSHNDGIIIGSVERFQGNERRVIILSTVRSKGEGMGFLEDYQRFNVAITRAKELLLVIGKDYYIDGRNTRFCQWPLRGGF